MILSFVKMHGAGNDYIFVDCRNFIVENPSALAINLSDRHFGVGGDGLVLIERSSCADVKMRMFNADGSEGLMCGNAVRCVVKYVYDNKIADKPCVTVETASGVKEVVPILDEGGQAVGGSVAMGKARFEPDDIPALLPTGEAELQFDDGTSLKVTCVNTGNPHCAVFCENDVNNVAVADLGATIENHAAFPKRVNVEFINVLSKTELKMRVWERGSGETLACGTGACAAVAAAVKRGYCPVETDITVRLRGGRLTVNCREDYGLTLTGAAEKVFAGTTEAY
ncbi:MAG: diaminopimelate epimerase [Clostridiaceae bacterium]|jgi:diaminopimelate epimerase|nr:diaminopimelate epimerase [Clostridiaceae bacterium]